MQKYTQLTYEQRYHIYLLNKQVYNQTFIGGHGGLRKEIKVRTPYEALEYWYNLKPDLFIRETLSHYQLRCA
jgi:hypothetical protein